MRARRRHNTRAELDLLDRVDATFAPQLASLTESQLAAIRTWQRMDRSYALIQQVARAEIDAERLPRATLTDAQRTQLALDEAIAGCRIPFDLTLFRGFRDLHRAFGTTDPSSLLAETIRFDGYSATSLLRRVAIDEFTTSKGALMKIAVKAGTQALWVSGAGSRQLRYQAEMLLQDNLQICVVGCQEIGGLVVIAAEVLAQ